MIKHTAGGKEQVKENGDDEEEMPSEADPFGDVLPPEFRHYFKQMPKRGTPMPRGEVSSVGSGVIIDPSGIILTNNHVVDGGGKIVVRLHDGREFEGFDIKTDPKTDLAIIHIKGAGPLIAAKFANSDEAQVGDWVLALGDPFGLEGTVTAGIISAKGRSLGNTPRESFIQTDAAINPGNSGGPLVNLDSEVVGINTAIHSQTGGYQGVGFAVSSNLAKWGQPTVERQRHGQTSVSRRIDSADFAGLGQTVWRRGPPGRDCGRHSAKYARCGSRTKDRRRHRRVRRKAGRQPARVAAGGRADADRQQGRFDRDARRQAAFVGSNDP